MAKLDRAKGRPGSRWSLKPGNSSARFMTGMRPRLLNTAAKIGSIDGSAGFEIKAFV